MTSKIDLMNLTSRIDLISLKTKPFVNSESFVNSEYSKKEKQKKLEEIFNKIVIRDKKPIDYWPRIKLEKKVVRVFKKYGHFTVSSLGYRILCKIIIKQLGFPDLRAARKYYGGKKKRS